LTVRKPGIGTVCGLRPHNHVLLRADDTDFLHIHTHTLKLRWDAITRAKLADGHFLVYHDDQTYFVCRLAFALSHADTDTDDVRLPHQVGFIFALYCLYTGHTIFLEKHDSSSLSIEHFAAGV
jgi:hypothetical protein